MPVLQTNIYIFIKNRTKKIDNPREKQLRLDICYQMLSGLAYCHSRNIIHLDIKPHNLLISDGMIKITDFGSSKALSCVSNRSEVDEGPTYPFRPPEIFFEKSFSTASDIWSAGCTIYYIMTAGLLFGGGPWEDGIFKIDLNDPIEFGPIESIVYQIFLFLDSMTADEKYFFALSDEWKDKYHDIYQLASNKQKTTNLIYGKIDDSEIIFLILSTLKYMPQDRPTALSLLNNPLFRDFRIYENETLRYYNCTENLHLRQRKPQPIIFSKEIDDSSIMIVKDWLIKLSLEYKLNHQTYFFACDLLHRSLKYIPIRRKTLQLYGIACFSIADSLYNTRLIEKADFVWFSAKIFTEKELSKAIHLIEETVNYDVVQTTPVDFLIEYQKDYNKEEQQFALAILHTLTFTSIYTEATPEELALMSLRLATYKTGTFLHVKRIDELLKLQDKLQEYLNTVTGFPEFFDHISKNFRIEPLSKHFISKKK